MTVNFMLLVHVENSGYQKVARILLKGPKIRLLTNDFQLKPFLTQLSLLKQN